MNLLEGPKSKINQYVDVTEKPRQSNKRNYIIFGHYEPPIADLIDTITGKDHSNKQLTAPSDNLWRITKKDQQNDDKIIIPEQAPNKSELPAVKDEELADSKPRYGLLKTSAVTIKHWFDHEENKILKLLMVCMSSSRAMPNFSLAPLFKVVLFGLLITMFWYFQSTVRELRQQSENGSKTKIPRSTDSNGSYGVEFDGGELFIACFCVYAYLSLLLIGY